MFGFRVLLIHKYRKQIRYSKGLAHILAELSVTYTVQPFTVLVAYLYYSGDLNSEHLNSGNIWIMNFYLFAIQMPANSLLFKTWPEYRTKSLLFKPSVTQPISQTHFDLNSELLVRYSSHVLNKKTFSSLFKPWPE